MNEFTIIKKYFSKLSKKNKGSFNLKDDIFFDYKKKIGISVDTYVEKTHFLNFENPGLIIKKVLRSSISDLICKGIKPQYYFIAFSGNKKHLTKNNLAKISLALKQEQKKYNILLSGGDTTIAEKLSITITVVGYSKRLPILRSGAKLNDDIYVTNTLGDSFLGLNILKKKIILNKKNRDYFINRFYHPNIPINFSKKMHLFANSSIDISDGFFQDLNHILSNSNFSSDIIVNKIPISNYLHTYLKKIKKDMLKFISNGDDYQILFTACKNKKSLIKKISRATHTKVSLVGIIKKKSVNDSLKIFKYPGYIHKF